MFFFMLYQMLKKGKIYKANITSITLFKLSKTRCLNGEDVDNQAQNNFTRVKTFLRICHT